MDHPHIVLVKRYLDAASRQEFEKAQSFFSDDFVYKVPGRSPLAGTHSGSDAAIAYFGKLMGLTEGSYRIENIVDWLVGENRVALIARESFTRGGRNVSWTRVVVFEVRGRQFLRVELFDDDLYAIDDALNA